MSILLNYSRNVNGNTETDIKWIGDKNVRTEKKYIKYIKYNPIII